LECPTYTCSKVDQEPDLLYKDYKLQVLVGRELKVGWGESDEMNAATGDDAKRHTESEHKSANRERHVTVLNNRLDSRDLFAGAREVIIVHGADAYHLRLTAQHKLILTK
jgi:hemin uptake protein HemP